MKIFSSLLTVLAFVFLSGCDSGPSKKEFQQSKEYTRALELLLTEDVVNNTEFLQKQAVSILEGLAHQGYAPAQFQLARVYDTNRLFRKIEGIDSKAIAFYEKAALQDYPPALYWLARIQLLGLARGDKTTAIVNLTRAANHGYSQAAIELAEHAESLNESFQWRLIAAKQGHPESQFVVAKSYQEGLGTERSNERALHWFLEAAKNNIEEAFVIVAKFFFEGIGTEKNEKEAFKWFLKSAESGDKESYLKVSEMYAQGTGVEKNEEQAGYWHKRYYEDPYRFVEGRDGVVTISLHKQLVDEALANLDMLHTQIRAVPFFQEGRSMGMKLLSIKPGNIFASLKLERGDVMLKINDVELDIKKGLEIFNEVKIGSVFNFDILRDNRLRRIRVTVVP